MPKWTALLSVLPWDKYKSLLLRKVAGLLTSKISPLLPLYPSLPPLFYLTLLLLLPLNTLTHILFLTGSPSRKPEPNRFLTMTPLKTLLAPLSIVPRFIPLFPFFIVFLSFIINQLFLLTIRLGTCIQLK